MIFIENKKRKIQRIKDKYPDAEILDLTSKSETKFIKLSPFYPIGNIPIPFSEQYFGASVEGIWQGLKVFEFIGIDNSKFNIIDMKNIKRSTRRNGKILGHQKGVFGNELLNYQTARKEIFISCYYWVLNNALKEIIDELINKAKFKNLVFLDYNTNEDLDDLSKPMSHAGLVKKIIIEKVKIYEPPVQGKLEFDF